MSKKILIIGLGQTGLSCVHYLNRQGYDLIVTDSRSEPPGLIELTQHYPNIPYYVGGFCKEIPSDLEMAVLSPGVSLQEPFVQQLMQKNIPIVGDIELFACVAKAPIIGITGTNGKSTVTALVGLMAEAAGRKVAVGGNIGTPALDLLSQQAIDLYVLELSSFQLETTSSLKLQAATILNIAPDHCDRYTTVADYALAKQRIYQHCTTAIYNRDDPATQPSKEIASVTFTYLSPKEKEFGLREIGKEIYLAYGKENLLSVNALKIKGQQNWLNALAALALGQEAGLPMSAMLQALQEFKGLPHRCEWVASIDDVEWYNDSKATNVAACIAAVSGLAAATTGKIILIAGGQGKKQDFSLLNSALQRKVRELILFGEDAKLIGKALDKKVSIQYLNDLTEAVHHAKSIACPQDVVLLAPACASFDMFDNYAHRGEVFRDLVRTLAL